MKRGSQKKRFGKKRKVFKKSSSKFGIYGILAFFLFLGLFSESVRTVPAGAFSELPLDSNLKIENLNSQLIEKKVLNASYIESSKIEYKVKKDEIIKTNQIKFFDEPKNLENNKTITIAKTPDIAIKNTEESFTIENKIKNKVLDVPKIEKTIKLAETSATTITVNGEEKVIPGTMDKNITYMQILQKPNDLELNLKYAQQQGKMGNYKQTIATLERLNMIYPDNIEIKLYLLSVLVQADSPNKALGVIEDIKANPDATTEDLETVSEIEQEMKDRRAPKLWYVMAEVSSGGVQSNNVNSVSKTRRQYSSGEISSFNSAMFDRTYTNAMSLTAIRSIGEASSFTINASFSDARQNVGTSDTADGYGLMLGYDTTIGNQSLSPYLMLGKTDYQYDADSFSLMAGLSGSFMAGERSTIGYGYTYSESKGNENSSGSTANETNAVGHSVSLEHGFMLSDIISTSLGSTLSISEAKVGTNDFVTYDYSARINLALPWSYISIGNGLSFNDYVHADSSTTSEKKRSDVTNTIDFMLIKAVGDFLPSIDPNKNLLMTLSMDRVFSEGNMMNYDYISDSISFNISKSFQLFKD